MSYGYEIDPTKLVTSRGVVRNCQTRLSTKSFKEKFHEAVLRADSSDSLYNAFVELSRKNLPAETSRQYEELKKRDYIAKNDLDVDIYVKHVASKHAGKFAVLYRHLFERFGETFSDCVDIVVWGCGCGLDLLALYDQAMKQNNPNFWMVVKSVTLIDISTVALKRAAEIAEVLFPSAIDRIKTIVVDFKSEKALNSIVLEESFLVVPRVHLFSNIFDLFEDKDLSRFIDKIKTVSIRADGKLNEVYVAFSPSYPMVKDKMGLFRSKFGGIGDAQTYDFILDEETPDRSYCSAFSIQTTNKSYFKWLQQPGDNFYKQLRRIALSDKSWFNRGQWDELFEYFSCSEAYERFALDSTLICEDCPTYAERATYAERERHIRCLVFVPKKELKKKLLVVAMEQFSRRDKWRVSRHFFDRVVANTDDAQLIAHAERIKSNRACNYEVFKYIRIIAWNCWEQGLPHKMEFDEYDRKHKKSWGEPLDREIDFSGIYMVKTDGVAPLPLPLRKQKKIALLRKQYLRVRGGPGTGKTVTMLWRAVYSLMRTHMPVLLLCKTNTLITYHERILAATFLSVNQGVDRVTRKMVHFDTIDHYLCNQNKRKCGCALIGEKHSRCDDMNQLCAKCRADAMQKILAPNSEWKSSEQYGAVLIDEAQIIDPDYVRQVYKLTGASNPYREFYMFCDEEQSIRGDCKALTRDDDTKKFVVKAPDVGFGKFVTLKENFRATSEDLIQIYTFIQKKMSDRYDIRELSMEGVKVQQLLGIQAAFAVVQIDKIKFDDFEDWILPDIEGNSAKGDLLILVDDEGLVREFSGKIEELNLQTKWMSTHVRIKNFVKEQTLRREFFKCRDCIHLTTIDCAQGQTFDRVILILKRMSFSSHNAMEELFTGLTRARNTLRVIDVTPEHEVYSLLKSFNPYKKKSDGVNTFQNDLRSPMGNQGSHK